MLDLGKRKPTKHYAYTKIILSESHTGWNGKKFHIINKTRRENRHLIDRLSRRTQKNGHKTLGTGKY